MGQVMISRLFLELQHFFLAAQKPPLPVQRKKNQIQTLLCELTLNEQNKQTKNTWGAAVYLTQGLFIVHCLGTFWSQL